MNEASYPVKRNQEIFQYEFFSEGPKGRIRKMIHFQSIDSVNNLYNLAFGDWNEEDGTIDDSVKSNNGDRQKILVTVAQTVFNFMELNPTVTILAQGSTDSRTRIYQMGIAAFWNEINKYFSISGYINDHWESFTEGRNYEAFLLVNKQISIFELVKEV